MCLLQALLPKQSTLVCAVIDAVGVGLTVTVTVSVVTQVPVVPVTVYTVFAEGETTTEAPVMPPGIHVYVSDPVAVSVTGDPSQVAISSGATTGGVTFTVTVCVVGHDGAAEFVAVTL